MAEATSSVPLRNVGFLSIEGDTTDLLVEQTEYLSSSPMPSDRDVADFEGRLEVDEQARPTGTPEASIYRGSAVELIDLLKHYDVQVAVVEVPAPEWQPEEESPARSAFVGHVTREVADALERAESDLEARGKELSDFVSAETLADRLVALIPTRSAWDDQVGPFYDAESARRCLGISELELDRAVSQNKLLELTTADGRKVYPAFQFTQHGRILSGLSEVLECFRNAQADTWTLAGWLTSPISALGKSPLASIQEDEDLGQLLVLAHDLAGRWGR